MAEQTVETIVNQLKTLLADKSPNYRSIVKLSNQLSKLDPKFQRFSVDAKTLIHLGRDSIKDHTTALIELVKNSYDADAFNVEVEVLCRKGNDLIRVADNGFGMTGEQLRNYWLRIGFSNKRKSKHSDLGRRKTGEKGIGRISTDRLGGKLELLSKTESDGIVGLIINWDEFDSDEKDIFDIDVELTSPTSINIPLKDGKESKAGTEIKISNLRQPWSSFNIENLYYELSALTSPFKDVVDFEIDLKNDVAEVFSKKVDADFYKASEIELTTIFDGSNEVYYSIKDKYSDKDIVDTITLPQFYSKAYPNDELQENLTLKCGAIEVKLLFFLREGTSVTGLEFKLSDLREFLDNNAGVKIYRDFIAVKPYGFPKAQLGYDWLGLGERRVRNPAGVGRASDYTVSPNQVVGAVFISRDNNLLLTDSAAREGLVESEGFYDLKEFVLASLRLLESHRGKIYPIIEKAKKDKQKTSAHKDAENIKLQLNSVKDNLTSIKEDIEQAGEKIQPSKIIKPIIQTIDKVDTIAEEVDSTINDLLNWQRVLSGLATMGISSAVFGHETEGSITQVKGSATTAYKLLTGESPKIDKAIVELDKAIKHSKKVAAWGAYALTRIQREKRSRRNVQIIKSIESVVKELKPAFEASSIEIKVRGENFFNYTYQMDIESILVNLLTNAYTACTLKRGERKVEILVERENNKDAHGYYFSVSDTGPGIAKEFRHRIFEPLFSTKTMGNSGSKSVGTGLGLTIVQSIVEDLNGIISVDHDPKLKGARFKIWLPKQEK